MSSGCSSPPSFSQFLGAFVEELRRCIIVEHEKVLKNKLAAVLEENEEFRRKLGMSPSGEEDLMSLQSMEQENRHSPTGSVPLLNGFTFGNATPPSANQTAKKAPPPPPLKSALKKKGVPQRHSRRASTQPAKQRLASPIGDSNLQLPRGDDSRRPSNQMQMLLQSKLDAPPLPADEPESLVLPNASPIKLSPARADGLPNDGTPKSAFGPVPWNGQKSAFELQSSAPPDSQQSAVEPVGFIAKQEAEVLENMSDEETAAPVTATSIVSSESRPYRQRRSLSNPPALTLFSMDKLENSSAAENDAQAASRPSAGPRLSSEKPLAVTSSFTPVTAGHSFVNDLPKFKMWGHSNTANFEDTKSFDPNSPTDDQERRFSWLRKRLPNLRRGSSFSSQLDSRSNSLIHSRKTSAILQAVKNLHVRFKDTNAEGDTSSEEEEAMHDRNDSLSMEEEESHHFWLSPIWLEKNEQVKTVRKTQSKVNLLDPQDASDVLGVEELRGATTSIGRLMERRGMIIHPKSGLRMLWALCGCLLYLYDAIVIPLQFFRLDFPMQRVIRWLVCCYWSIDIPLSFFNGTVQLHGTIELRPEKIVRRYIQTWLVVDIFMVVMDWLQLARDSESSESSEWGLMRMRKVARTMRMFRLFWYIKLMQTVSLPEYVRLCLLNERLPIIVDIIKIIVFIVGVNHLIACFWYGIGSDDQLYSWAAQEEFRDAASMDLYAVSFLWSLSQFTGSLDINMPRNPNERAFSIFVLLFTFVFSAFAISSITSSMTQLQIITAQQSRQFAALRRYLNANSISKALAMRIHRSARNAVEDLAKNTPERSVELLQLVSDPLRQELHYEVHAPALMVHPFFKFYNRVYGHALRQICHNAVLHLSLHRGDLLFSQGEMPSEEDLRMFFIQSGRLTYMHFDKFPASVKAGAYACEAAIWTMWPYHGTMRAKADCSLTLLDAHKFQKIACQFMSRNVNPVLYGKEFVKFLNMSSRRDLSDLEMTDFDTAGVAQAVFMPEEVEARERRGSDRRTSENSTRTSARGWLNALNNFGQGRLSRLTETHVDRQCTLDKLSSFDVRTIVERSQSQSRSQLDLSGPTDKT